MQINGRIVKWSKIWNEREIDLRKRNEKYSRLFKDLINETRFGYGSGDGCKCLLCQQHIVQHSIWLIICQLVIWYIHTTISLRGHAAIRKKGAQNGQSWMFTFPTVSRGHFIAQCWGLHASSILSGSAESNWWLRSGGILWHSSITGGVPYLKDQD